MNEKIVMKREKHGQCIHCGIQCYEIKKVGGGLMKKKEVTKIPLNVPGKVDHGRCLKPECTSKGAYVQVAPPTPDKKLKVPKIPGKVVQNVVQGGAHVALAAVTGDPTGLLGFVANGGAGGGNNANSGGGTAYDPYSNLIHQAVQQPQQTNPVGHVLANQMQQIMDQQAAFAQQQQQRQQQLLQQQLQSNPFGDILSNYNNQMQQIMAQQATFAQQRQVDPIGDILGNYNNQMQQIMTQASAQQAAAMQRAVAPTVDATNNNNINGHLIMHPPQHWENKELLCPNYHKTTHHSKSTHK
jgi:hypothetical protein